MVRRDEGADILILARTDAQQAMSLEEALIFVLCGRVLCCVVRRDEGADILNLAGTDARQAVSMEEALIFCIMWACCVLCGAQG